VILTVTLNTALHLTYRVPKLTPHTSHRVTDIAERLGGKGLGAARVLAALGHEVTVTGFAGGTTGSVLRRMLVRTGPGITDALFETRCGSRRTVSVVDESTGDTTRLDEPGPLIDPTEWSGFLDAYEELLRTADAVALCGSLPPGVPVGAYGHLVRQARAARVPVLLDTSGEPLRRGIAARPDLVKPNAEELARLTGSREPLRAARDARRRGAHAVVASLGPDGLLAVTPDGTWHAAPPARLPGDPADAGDSAVAGLLSGLVGGLPWPERLARAAALSAAGEFDRAVYEELLPRVEVTEGAAAA
jgi:tagatose 6-phosphate kinase